MAKTRRQNAMVLEGAAQAIGLGISAYDELDTLRDWRNRKYRAGYAVLPDELAEAIEVVTPFLNEVTAWFQQHHGHLITRGLTP